MRKFDRVRENQRFAGRTDFTHLTGIAALDPRTGSLIQVWKPRPRRQHILHLAVGDRLYVRPQRPLRADGRQRLARSSPDHRRPTVAECGKSDAARARRQAPSSSAPESCLLETVPSRSTAATAVGRSGPGRVSRPPAARLRRLLTRLCNGGLQAQNFRAWRVRTQVLAMLLRNSTITSSAEE